MREPAMKPVNIDAIELDLFFEAVLRVYGYDFIHYARAYSKCKVLSFLNKVNLENCSQLQEKIIHDKNMFSDFLLDMSTTFTEMFRDPGFYKALRKKVAPILKTYPFIKIWHAGCATGEEVYSMAILLHEEGLFERTNLYATDLKTINLSLSQSKVFILLQR